MIALCEECGHAFKRKAGRLTCNTCFVPQARRNKNKTEEEKREALRIKNREYWRDNPERRAKHREHMKDYMKEWRKKQREKKKCLTMQLSEQS